MSHAHACTYVILETRREETVKLYEFRIHHFYRIFKAEVVSESSVISRRTYVRGVTSADDFMNN